MLDEHPRHIHAQRRIHTIYNHSNFEVTDWSEGTIPSAGIQVMVNAIIDRQH